jgi:hypothetical protein
MTEEEYEQWPYKDAWGQKLDIGDLVKFDGDGSLARTFRIIMFTKDGAKALIYSTPTRKYWVPIRKVVWVR